MAVAIVFDAMTDAQIDDHLRGDVMKGIAQTLCALCGECCPDTDADARVIRAWHELLDGLAVAAREALWLTGWTNGRPFVDAIVAHVRNEYEEDDALSTDWWRALSPRCYALKWAAAARWPEIIYPDDDCEEE